MSERSADDDVVTELDAFLTARHRWLEDWQMQPPANLDDLLQRARDEIVAMRQKNVEAPHLVAGEINRRAREQALEEAARKAEHYELPIWSAMIAAAIRALKNKR